MPSLSIKAKVSAVTVLCLGIGGFGLVRLFERSYSRNIDMVTEQSLRNARSAYETLYTSNVAKMNSVLELAMANPELREAFANKDRERLLTLTQPLYERMKKTYGISNFNYINADQLRLLVMNDPKDPAFIGTKATRFNIEQCVRTKSWVSGLALGGAGFALRTTHPVYDNGLLKGDKLIGYLELGQEISGFLNAMKAQTGNDYGIVIRKASLKEKDWTKQRAVLGLPNNWEAQKDIVLGGNTWKDETIFSYTGDVTTLAPEGAVLGVLFSGNTIFSRSVFPIVDASGTKVGGIFVLVDISQAYRELQVTKKATLYTVGALIITICALLIFLLATLVFRRLTHITAVATRLVGGDFETPVMISTNDEIGAFERLFEQLRQVFVNLVEEHGNLAKEHAEKEPKESPNH